MLDMLDKQVIIIRDDEDMCYSEGWTGEVIGGSDTTVDLILWEGSEYETVITVNKDDVEVVE